MKAIFQKFAQAVSDKLQIADIEFDFSDPQLEAMVGNNGSEPS